MALQFDDPIRNDLCDVIETRTGTAPILRVFTGPPPVNCAAADTGTLISEKNLPSDWMEVAGTLSPGVKRKLGTWQDLSANNSGAPGHFRIYSSGGTPCRVQGTVGLSAADMIVNVSPVTAGQSFTVDVFTLTAPGA
jgi:hypothetical protein